MCTTNFTSRLVNQYEIYSPLHFSMMTFQTDIWVAKVDECTNFYNILNTVHTTVKMNTVHNAH